jgi:excisionase family DNA binding protein
MKPKNEGIIPNTIDEPDKLLTIAQVADRCQVSTNTIKKWLDEGRLSYAVLGDGTKYDSVIRVRESVLIKFWRKSERKALP